MLNRESRRTLRRLAAAAAAAESVRLRFLDTEAAEAERVVDVLGLSFEADRWTVATWTSALRSLRLLPLERIRSVRRTVRAAGPAPDGFDGSGFALRPLLGAGPPVAVAVPPGDARVATAILPAGRWSDEGGAHRTWLVHSCDPRRVRALTSSLGWDLALDSPGAPHPAREGVGVASPEARILKLVSFILAQPGAVTAQQIFERFPREYGEGATAKERQARDRMFSRDKEAVRKLGFVLAKAGDDAYLIDARSSRLPALELAPEEALAVWTAATAALRHSDHPLRWDLENALRKVMTGWRGLPPRAGQPEDLGGDGASPVREDLLEKLVDGWLRRKRVTIDYWKASRDEVEARQVDVYGWARRRGEWIFVGHCHKRDAVRIFYLSRVRRLSTPQAKERDARADYVIPASFDLRRWSRQQIWDYEVHAPKAAAVRFSGSLARVARQLLPGAKSTLEADGRRVCRLSVCNLRGLVRQALAWGPEAELIEPAEGRAMALEILREVRALGAGGRP